MKAISLWQPWASLLACGAKKYETRSWSTKYRGPIAIHAALTPFKRVMKKVFPLHEWSYAPDYSAKRKFVDLVSKFIDIDNLCYGSIIATAELIGCHEMRPYIDDTAESCILIGSEYQPITGNEYLFGDWTPGRYAWEFANVTMLPEPIPAKGRQGLWNWEESGDE